MQYWSLGNTIDRPPNEFYSPDHDPLSSAIQFLIHLTVRSLSLLSWPDHEDVVGDSLKSPGRQHPLLSSTHSVTSSLKVMRSQFS